MKACYKIDLTREPFKMEQLVEVANNHYAKRTVTIDQFKIIKEIRDSLIKQFGEGNVLMAEEDKYSVVYVE